MTFDLVVWALDDQSTSADVHAAHELCRQGEHADGDTDRRITSFHAALTADYPDRGAAATGEECPWAKVPLHTATDHIEMNLRDTCDDAVLLAIERLAQEHDLLLLDPQDGSVYPPTTSAPTR
ncbi:MULTISPECIES: hypothetical protein [unclassified Solwaraspora]|uniref:hypothetical protein n=1 Tax=unclassified Solwaraspora TaxID=2627926 RepID=UPI00259B9E0D|nr:hypothetical protein [Solwaraspora sp. WMMA2056]WJK40085.1 hypothetical protein O7608_27285 [Solwaraspora sp. WMMA2056]